MCTHRYKWVSCKINNRSMMSSSDQTMNLWILFSPIFFTNISEFWEGAKQNNFLLVNKDFFLFSQFWAVKKDHNKYWREKIGEIQQLRGHNFAIFWPTKPLNVDSFYQDRGQKPTFFNPPPHLVHVVIECPLTILWV